MKNWPFRNKHTTTSKVPKIQKGTQGKHTNPLKSLCSRTRLCGVTSLIPKNFTNCQNSLLSLATCKNQYLRFTSIRRTSSWTDFSKKKFSFGVLNTICTIKVNTTVKFMRKSKKFEIKTEKRKVYLEVSAAPTNRQDWMKAVCVVNICHTSRKLHCHHDICMNSTRARQLQTVLNF